MNSMVSRLHAIPRWLMLAFACLGLISCGGGGGGGGGGGSAAKEVAECFQFVSGYTWGSVRSADIKLGGETASNAKIQVIADPAVPAAPNACSSTGPGLNTVQTLGANGTIGLSNFAQDCGQSCASQTQNGFYYACAGSSCSPIAVALANQLWNPVALFATDNNGTILSLPAVSSAGATQVSGILTFGIGTQANNGVGSATVVNVDPNNAEFTAAVGATSYPGSFIDSGSNGLFYGSNLFPLCNGAFSEFYCPPSPQAQNGFLDPSGVNLPVNFTVSNPQALAAAITADAELAAPGFGGVDWGLPLFFGRSIYTSIQGMSTPAGSGAWLGITSGSVSSGGTNQVPVVVDAGPPGANVINSAYVSVTLCAPGSTTNCQTIDHLQVDTGASGVRVLASALQPALLAALPQSTP
ncbi:MAG TPA: DUF3443 family protein [Thiobacillaceae bacterium]|nr:DUF3443 family protein [Thiobacillaceae bacterium]